MFVCFLSVCPSVCHSVCPSVCLFVVQVDNCDPLEQSKVGNLGRHSPGSDWWSCLLQWHMQARVIKWQRYKFKQINLLKSQCGICTRKLGQQREADSTSYSLSYSIRDNCYPITCSHRPLKYHPKNYANTVISDQVHETRSKWGGVTKSTSNSMIR